MKAKTIRPRIKAIQYRFFRALNDLIDDGRMQGGLEGFCAKYRLHKPKYSTLRSALYNPDKTSAYRLIDIDAMSHLVFDYGVNADWLMTGRGSMYKKIDVITKETNHVKSKVLYIY